MIFEDDCKGKIGETSLLFWSIFSSPHLSLFSIFLWFIYYVYRDFPSIFYTINKQKDKSILVIAWIRAAYVEKNSTDSRIQLWRISFFPGNPLEIL